MRSLLAVLRVSVRRQPPVGGFTYRLDGTMEAAAAGQMGDPISVFVDDSYSFRALNAVKVAGDANQAGVWGAAGEQGRPSRPGG